ncbi:hypothetical protein [Cerasicoccus frondis]|uniref:hypothetical protein n=1 Tax=Cerasicoccus frondis TaxID=490090 RepID=UPI0028525ACE|nr:hypothetical protein [Cerasicoccus frondis]
MSTAEPPTESSEDELLREFEATLRALTERTIERLHAQMDAAAEQISAGLHPLVSSVSS